MNPLKGLFLLASLIAFSTAVIEAQPTDNLIRPGKGWKGTVIGASRAAVQAEIGKPEITTPGTDETFATYTTRGIIVRYAGTPPVVAGITIIGDGTLYASTSVKFGSFTGLPDKNIKWRATEAELIAAYGPPTERSSFIQNSSKLEIAELTYPGAEFIFKGNKLFQVKVMAMPAAASVTKTAAKPAAHKKDGRALFDAAKKGDEALVRQLIAEGSELDYEFEGDTTLENAIRYRKVNIARILLEAGADPNFQGPNKGGTALFIAAQMRDDDTLALLLDQYKANPDLTTNSGRTALHQAAEFSNASGTAMLLKAGANPNVVDDQGRSPLVLARSSDASYVIKHLEPVTNLALIAQLKAKSKPVPQPTPVAAVVQDDDEDDYELNQVLLDVLSLARKDGFRQLEEGETESQGRNDNSESGAPRQFASPRNIYQFVAIGKDVQTVNAIMNGTLLTIPCDGCRTSISEYWTSVASTKSRGYEVISLQFKLLNVQNNWLSLIPKAQEAGGRIRWILLSKPGK